MPDVLKLLASNSPFVLGVGIAFAAGSFGWFLDREGRLQEDYRDSIRNGLKSTFVSGDLARLVVRLFDFVFQPTATGRPKLWRSALVSCVLLVMLTAVWWSLWPERAATMWSDVGPIYVFPAFAISINVLGDFLSIWETRLVVGLLARVRGPWRICWLLLDFLATIVIYLSGVVVGSCLYVVMSEIHDPGGIPEALASLALMMPPLVYYALVDARGLLFVDSADPAWDFLVLCFYTATVTSVWTWIFMVGMKVGPVFKWLVGRALNVDRWPVFFAMTGGGVLVGLAVGILGSIWQHLASV